MLFFIIIQDEIQSNDKRDWLQKKPFSTFNLMHNEKVFKVHLSGEKIISSNQIYHQKVHQERD